MAVVNGTPAGETLDGTDLADTINGLDGSDILNGFAGNDILDGGAGNDAIDAGDGNDIVRGFTAGDTVDGGAGNDTLVLIATSAALNAATDADLANVELVSAASALAGVVIDLGNQLEAIAITGGKFADTITGTGAANIINAGAGNDIIIGFAGADSIIGGKGTDTLLLTETSADLNSATNIQLATVERISAATAGAGVVIDLHLQTEAIAVIGSDFDDVITSGAGADIVSAGAGNDIINGYAGSDTVDGGAGDDTLVVAATSAALNAASDARIVNVETISAAAAAAGVTISLAPQTEGFTIIGSAFNDVIGGSAGADTIEAGAGNDSITSFSLGDHVDGGANVDTLALSGTSLALNTAGDGDITNIEIVSALRAATIDLSNQSESFVIIGSRSADILIGGSGDDVLIGGAGADLLVGGAGVDTVSYAGSLRGVGIDLSMGQGHEADAQGDVYVGIENAIGGFAADGILGDDNDNVLDGGPGNDVILGGAGNDTIIGGDGVDTIFGGDGIDTISYVGMTSGLEVFLNNFTRYENGTLVADTHREMENVIGGSGNDKIYGDGNDNVLDGGPGDDLLYGAGGADTFVFVSGCGFDTVTDFTTGTDKIDLTGIVGVHSFADITITPDEYNSVKIITWGVEGEGFLVVTPAPVAPDFIFA